METFNSLNEKNITEEELKNEAYRQFELAFSAYKKFKRNIRIKRKLRILKQHSNFDSNDILHELFKHYLNNVYHENYDQEKAKFSTFIVNFINKNLNNLLRTEVPAKMRERSTFQSGDIGDLSDSLLNQYGTDETFETRTPEDLCIAKELFEKMLDHYGADYASVLLGEKDRESIANEIGVKYDTLCKRINRLTAEFKQSLYDIGYC